MEIGRISLTSIVNDTSIQTRETLSHEAVIGYAERMENGEMPPPIVVFGTEQKCWIGDGWHRTAAAERAELESLPCDLREGGRLEALRYALGANREHGVQLNRKDKRRAVEVAIKEMPNMTSRQIAEAVGVHDMTVEKVRTELHNYATGEKTQENQEGETEKVEYRTGKDGKQYPAKKKGGKKKAQPDTAPASTDATEEDAEGVSARDLQPIITPEMEQYREPEPTGFYRNLPKPCRGRHTAESAIRRLNEITLDDREIKFALRLVAKWLGETNAALSARKDK